MSDTFVFPNLSTQQCIVKQNKGWNMFIATNFQETSERLASVFKKKTDGTFLNRFHCVVQTKLTL